uniref:Uncharacterized protein n=1 Tax=Knipowitschia caucasica TaxID=637954 RepID=A0AAV2LWI8_KNICA
MIKKKEQKELRRACLCVISFKSAARHRVVSRTRSLRTAPAVHPPLLCVPSVRAGCSPLFLCSFTSPQVSSSACINNAACAMLDPGAHLFCPNKHGSELPVSATIDRDRGGRRST